MGETTVNLLKPAIESELAGKVSLHYDCLRGVMKEGIKYLR
jgi:hypothetical protein